MRAFLQRMWELDERSVIGQSSVSRRNGLWRGSGSARAPRKKRFARIAGKDRQQRIDHKLVPDLCMGDVVRERKDEQGNGEEDEGLSSSQQKAQAREGQNRQREGFVTRSGRSFSGPGPEAEHAPSGKSCELHRVV